jgi:peroxiredoxin (alkyl hydroperoxide reductase subunit C)
VIADLDQRVSQAYGLVHEVACDTSTVRSVFVIDPKGNVRALLYYPMQLGRNVDELLRIFQGLQTSDANGVSCPVNWQPGQKVIVAPPLTTEEAAKRLNGGGEGFDVTTWYLAMKNIPAQIK